MEPDSFAAQYIALQAQTRLLPGRMLELGNVSANNGKSFSDRRSDIGACVAACRA